MKLLVDHNLPPGIGRGLSHFFPEHRIVALADCFPVDTPDVDWIGALDREGGWSVVTRDLRIRSRPQERRALDAARIVFFFLAAGWKKMTHDELVWRIVRWFPILAAQAALADRGRFELPINPGSKLRQQRD